MTGIAATPDGGGYWLVGSDGGVFDYGNAAFLGSVPGQGIVGQPPVVGITRTPSGAGYWLVGSNGAVYAYGDAAFLGSPNGTRLNAPGHGPRLLVARRSGPRTPHTKSEPPSTLTQAPVT